MASPTRFRPFVALLGLTLLWSCSPDTGIRRLPLEPDVSPGLLKVSPDAATLAWIGATTTLTAQVSAADGKALQGYKYSWRSLDESIVKVTATGRITGVAEGTGRVVVTVVNLADTATVLVQRRPATITLSADSVLFTEIGASQTIAATVVDGGGQVLDSVPRWSSSDTSVATVTSGGTVTAKKQGLTTVKAVSGAASMSLKVRVSVGAHSVTLSPSSVTADAVGDTVTLIPTVLDAAGNTLPDPQISFQSGDTTVATVTTAGLVTSTGVGTTQITVYGDTVSAKVVVRVTQTPTAVTVTPDSVTLISGATQAYAATVADRNGNAVANAGVVWSSTDTLVATVSSDGVATGVGEGSTWIVGAAGAVADSAWLTVTNKGVKTVLVTPDSISLLIGGKDTLAISYLDSMGVALAGPVATWTSSDPSVATVDANGIVTGVAGGTTYVKAAVGAAADSTIVVVPAAAFTITLQFFGSVTPTAGEQAAFDAAKARWESVVIGDLADIPMNLSAGDCGAGSPAVSQTVDDVLILATFDSIDGPSEILGGGAPCAYRVANHLTAVGVMQFDTADVGDLVASGDFTSVVTHEMGHVLGFGTTATGFPWDDTLMGKGGSDPYWPGATAVPAYDAAGGTAANKVPVENQGGAGTRDAHWLETDMGNEMMTGYLTGATQPLSAITIGALRDMGYVVNLSAADAYSVGAALRLQGSGRRIHLLEPPMSRPLGITSTGNVIR